MDIGSFIVGGFMKRIHIITTGRKAIRQLFTAVLIAVFISSYNIFFISNFDTAVTVFENTLPSPFKPLPVSQAKVKPAGKVYSIANADNKDGILYLFLNVFREKKKANLGIINRGD